MLKLPTHSGFHDLFSNTNEIQFSKPKGGETKGEAVCSFSINLYQVWFYDVALGFGTVRSDGD
jgi:hypothetical protein